MHPPACPSAVRPAVYQAARPQRAPRENEPVKLPRPMPLGLHPAFPANNIAVALAADDQYLPYLYVAALSVIEHSVEKACLDFIILYFGSREEEARELIRPLSTSHVSVRLLPLEVDLSSFHISRHISCATYNRLFLPELLPNYERILYMDCDTLCLRDISPLFHMPLGDNYIAACRDMSYDTIPRIQATSECGRFTPYVNCGILLMNLAAMRRDGIQEKLVACAAEKNHPLHDQTVLNIICQGRIALLPEEWNFCLHNWAHSPILLSPARKRCAEHIRRKSYAILHFCSPRKPWHGDSLSPLAPLWWDTARRTPFYDKLKAAAGKNKMEWRKNLLKLLRHPGHTASALSWLWRRLLEKRPFASKR